MIILPPVVPPRLTLEERMEFGRQPARDLPLEQLGDPPVQKRRPDIVEMLQREGRDRIAGLLPLRPARSPPCGDPPA